MSENQYKYTPLPEPIPITEQEWPEGTVPLVHTRTMTYNHEDYIRECIEGILMQKTTFPVQVLIHDDASTDSTPDIVREYAEKHPKLIKAYYQKDNSYSKSKEEKKKMRSSFYKWMIGKYEASCEGDDYWVDPLKLQKQVYELENAPNINICFSGGFKYYDISKKLIEDYKYSDSVTIFPPRDVILGGGDFMPTASVVLRTKVVNTFPDWKKRAPVGDYYTQILASLPDGAIYYPENMCVYRKEVPRSWSNTYKNTETKVIKWMERHCMALKELDKYTEFKYSAAIKDVIKSYKKTVIRNVNISMSKKKPVYISMRNELSGYEKVSLHYLINNKLIISVYKKIFKCLQKPKSE